jgi:hypothetical protein
MVVCGWPITGKRLALTSTSVTWSRGGEDFFSLQLMLYPQNQPPTSYDQGLIF